MSVITRQKAAGIAARHVAEFAEDLMDGATIAVTDVEELAKEEPQIAGVALEKLAPYWLVYVAFPGKDLGTKSGADLRISKTTGEVAYCSNARDEGCQING